MILSATSGWEYISERWKPLGFWGLERPPDTQPLVPSARWPFSVMAPVKFRPVSAPGQPSYKKYIAVQTTPNWHKIEALGAAILAS